MPALNLTSQSRRPWSEAVREAAEWSRREGEVFFIAQCRDVAQELYQQTAAIAPSRAEIAADVKAQGWEIPAYFGKVTRDDAGHIDGGERMGRGLPYMWANQATSRKLKRQRSGKRGRPEKGTPTRDEVYAKIMTKGPTLSQMQQFVTAKRSRARLYLASGWLGALFDLGGALGEKSGAVDQERGGADILRSPGGVTVSLWNRTKGMAEQDAKHHIVDKAMAVRLLDLAKYMSDRTKEAYRGIFK